MLVLGTREDPHVVWLIEALAEHCSVEADTSAKIDCFMRGMGLFCGSLDFIVDESEDLWFLECNQQGAWGWLDAQQGGRIRRLFAEQIASVAAIG